MGARLGIDTHYAAWLQAAKKLTRETKITWRSKFANPLFLYEKMLHIAIIFSAVIFAAFFIKSISLLNIWFDEAYSLWATDNSVSWRYLFSNILRHETNPPIHFVILKIARTITDQNIVAGKILNLFILLMSIWIIIRENADKPVKCVFLYAILGTSAILAYAGEIRPLFTALCVAHILSYFYVLAEANNLSRPLIKITFTSVLLSLIHVYGAIFAISIAVAGALCGTIYKRYDLTKLCLTTLTLSCGAFLVWWMWINSTDRDALATVRWLSNDPVFLVEALKEGVGYIIGRGPISYFSMFLSCLFFIFIKESRINRSMVLLTTALFFFIPLLISWKVPIVFGRYFAIGCSPLIGMFLHCIWREFKSGQFEQYDLRKRALVSSGLVVFMITAILGPLTAIKTLQYRPYWTGIDTVTEFAANCPHRKIRVIDPIKLDEDARPGRSSASVLYGYKLLASRSGLDVIDGRESVQDISEIECPVVAWIEHSNLFENSGDAITASQMQALRLTNNYGVEVTVFRHRMGAVVVKKAAVKTISK